VAREPFELEMKLHGEMMAPRMSVIELPALNYVLCSVTCHGAPSRGRQGVTPALREALCSPLDKQIVIVC